MRAVILIAPLLAMLAAADAAAQDAKDASMASPVTSVRVNQPRDFGYFPGDVITREVYVTVEKPFRLETGSLPQPGALNYWLELRNVDLAEDEKGDSRRYKLTLAYQSFYVPLEVKSRDLPAFTLDFAAPGSDGGEGDERGAQARVPAFSFLMSPLREIQSSGIAKGDDQLRLKPDRPPRLLDTGAERNGLAASAVVALLALLLLAHHYAAFPFHKRSRRPFTEGARAIRAELRRGESRGEPDKAYLAALLTMHRAIDTAAERRLFAEDLPDFLNRHRSLAPYGPEMTRFFESSREAFFNDDVAGAEAMLPPPELVALAGKLAAAEREG